MKNIISVAKKQRRLRLHEARNVKPQYRTLMEYSQDMFNKIHNEVLEDDFILKIPMLM